MTIRLEARSLRGEPLAFNSFLGEDVVVEVAGLRAGWILAGSPHENSQRIWWWTMTGPACGMARVQNVGQCATLDDAMAQFREAYERWLDWALAQPEEVVWFGTRETPRHVTEKKRPSQAEPVTARPSA